MKQRGGTRGKAAKSRRRKTVTPKRATTPKTRRNRAPSTAELQGRLDLRTRELREALEQQAATSEVLRVISRSPGELEPIFQSMLENAIRICEAKFGMLFLWEGDGNYRVAALYGAPPRLVTERQPGTLIRPMSSTVLGRVASTYQTCQIADVQAEQGYLSAPSGFSPSGIAMHGGARTEIGVPMLKDDKLVGTIVIFRTEVRPFTDKQNALLTNFAAQAVIAIENARLLNELRQRTDDLSEALEQQTATSEVLGVISSSPGELQPVFQAMLENATRVCEAKFGMLFRLDDGIVVPVASLGVPQHFLDFIGRGPQRPSPNAPITRAAALKQVVHVADFAADQAYVERNPMAVAGVELAGVRTLLVVPMLKENEFVGAFAVFRQEVRPFSDKQIELVQNFAAQAVIAIENTRLLNELRQRTDDLSESLEQQTATSEVLQVISSSPGDLQPVFEAMLRNATRICGAKFGDAVLLRWRDCFLPVACRRAAGVWWNFRRREPFDAATPGRAFGRVSRTKQVIHIADVWTRQPMPTRSFTARLASRRAGRSSSFRCSRTTSLVGAIVIYRQEVRPFTDKQIELVQNFAAQAVIAIENTRLLNELRQRTDDLTEALEQQTATSEVLKVISSSPGELQPVFEAMLANATRLCEASYGVMWLREGNGFRSAALHGPLPAAYIERWRGGTLVHPGPDTPMMRVAETRRPVQIPDMRESRAYLDRDPLPVEAVEVAGIRTLLSVPMFKDTELVGAITIYRQEVRPFSDKQVELVSNFANQAVIAIESTRLLNELRQRTDDLTESLEQQTATSEVLKIISASPAELQPVFQATIDNATRLCGAKFGALSLREGDVFRNIANIAMHGVRPAYFEERLREPIIRPTPGHNLERLLHTKAVVHIPDLAIRRESGTSAVRTRRRSRAAQRATVEGK